MYSTIIDKCEQPQIFPIESILTQIDILPITKLELITVLQKIETNHNFTLSMQIRKEIDEKNMKEIQIKFIAMMQEIFKVIEPELKNFRKFNCLSYLDSIILKQLDPKIYHKGYILHKKPLLSSIKHEETQVANKMFNEIFEIMNELLTTMKIYFGYENEQQMSQAIFQSIQKFVQNNQNCVLAIEDRKTFIEQQKKQEQQKKNTTEGAPYDILLDVLNAVGKDQNNIIKSTGMFGKATNLISVVYNYAVSPVAGYTYSKIKNINPFEYSKKLTKQQQVNFRLSLIQNMSQMNHLQQKITIFQNKMMVVSLQEMVTFMNQKQKDQFVNFITQILSEFENPNGTFIEIVQQIMILLQLISNTEYDQKSEHFLQFKEAKWIIIFYKAFQEKYSPERRRVLLKVCHHPQIKQKLSNSIGLLKLIQSQNMKTTVLLQKLRNTPVTKTTKQKSQTTIIMQNEKIIQQQIIQQQKTKQQQEQEKQIDKYINLQLQRIHMFELNSKKQAKVPVIKFDRLTNNPPKRFITLLFSGFMSQDTCKVSEWKGLLDTIYDSEIYSVRYQSKTYGSVFDYVVDTAKSITQANMNAGFLAQLIGGPYLKAIAIIRQAYKKYNENPFNPAFESAKCTGEYLAEFIMANFSGHFVNMVGFSLGSQVIYHILLRLAHKKKLYMVNKIYFMGGATDINNLVKLLQKQKNPLSITNLYSNNDNVLKYLLRLSKPSLRPVGLSQIPQIHGHNIKNRDLSIQIKGHLCYRQNLNLLAKLMNMCDD